MPYVRGQNLAFHLRLFKDRPRPFRVQWNSTTQACAHRVRPRIIELPYIETSHIRIISRPCKLFRDALKVHVETIPGESHIIFSHGSGHICVYAVLTHAPSKLYPSNLSSCLDVADQQSLHCSLTRLLALMRLQTEVFSRACTLFSPLLTIRCICRCPYHVCVSKF